MQARAASAPLLPAFTPARSSACSRVSQDPEGDRRFAVERELADAFAHLARHVLEVRGAAADHAAQHHDAGVLPALGKPAHDARKLEGAGHAHDVDAAVGDAVAQQGVLSAVEQLLGDERVEAAHHQREAPFGADEVTFEDACHGGGDFYAQSSAPAHQRSSQRASSL